MLLLPDMSFIKHDACTKVNLHCTMPLFPITKMVKLLLLSHDQHYMHKNDRHDKKLQNKPMCKLWVFQKTKKKQKQKKTGCKKRFIGGDHDKTSRLGYYL